MESNPEIDALVTDLYGGANQNKMSREDWNKYQRERYRERTKIRGTRKQFETKDDKNAYQKEQYRKRKGSEVRKYDKITADEDRKRKGDLKAMTAEEKRKEKNAYSRKLYKIRKEEKDFEKLLDQITYDEPEIPDNVLDDLMEQLDQERIQEEGMYNKALPPRTGILEFSDLF
jgi:uncharacterized protein with von Willebrand factor type A (vWA) domain